MPWLLGTSFNVLLWNVASAFVAESARNDSDLRDHLRRTVRLGVATCLGGMVFLLAGAGLVLAVVGHQYAVEGATPLRIIALSFPFQAIVVLASAFAMLRQRMWVVVATQAATTALFLTLLTVLSRRVGLIGPATAYLIAQVFAATVLSPSLVGAVRSLVRSDHPRESW
jgi:O-antigen/teichoic acid export membrane protein